MRTQSAAVGLLLMLVVSTVSAGCLGLVMQREIMESLRDDPEVINKEESYFWDVTFDSDSIEAIQYTNETQIQFDETVSKLTITFRAQFPYSSILEQVVPNGTNEYRYAEVRVWEPGVKAAGGNPYWEVKATQDYPLERFEFSDLVNGNWLVEIDARGYGWDSPVDQASFHDHFDMSLTITKPCVRFAEIHDPGECTDLSVLQDR
ncbi:TPA: hypothetical protein HA325_00790 [Candidatus Thalassarchaeaceae archaeon]|jgi:hypothetical protein|nr:hypothetical protein [Euryarchaeota archaeon]DAC67568.1 MAG TPA: hypothetical protein D7I15_00800 [Candidatus Poseidoniales archaeon]HII43146.1 hypothetical protein [Candidatus Thalassarchaeaceae archaeon]|tara:strand:+ start:770 stop:1384 length:615 start_codon:yes stop_codon:yes gene_type:complete